MVEALGRSMFQSSTGIAGHRCCSLCLSVKPNEKLEAYRLEPDHDGNCAYGLVGA
jgi:hypothetical protein